MENAPNMLVTYNPAYEKRSRMEVIALLRHLKEDVTFFENEVEGIFLLQVGREPKEVVKKLRHLCDINPEIFRLTHSWVPLDMWIGSDITSMQRNVAEFADKIKDTESWKIEIKKRGHDASLKDLIEKLTDTIENSKVDLKDPDKIIRVEIVKNRAGLSLLEKDDIFYTTVAKNM